MNFLLSTSKVPPPKKGSALLAILMFVAVLTLMLLSYLISMQMDQMSTNSYSHSIRAEEIGLGGLQEIIDDIRKEIDAGSLKDGSPAGSTYTINGTRIYLPGAPQSTLPAKIGFASTDYGKTADKLPQLLLRASRASDPFYTSPPTYFTDPALLPKNYASAVSSITPSANGRILSPGRWNKPMLLGTSLPTAFYQSAALNKTPDWVYVTRSGRKQLVAGDLAGGNLKADPSGQKTNAVLGRYAYMIYDQSALLDVNVAGYPSNTNSATVYQDPGTGIGHTLRGKSTTAYADLLQLNGLTGKQAAVNSLIRWRNSGGLALTGLSNTDNNQFLKAVASYLPKGFTSFESGDNPLLGRQDLIDFFTKLKNDNLVADLSALQYLGTFSRSINAPSWQPTDAASISNSSPLPALTGNNGTGSVYAYHKNSETAGQANRNFANVRFPADANITHYNDDATTTSYKVEEGDPLLQRRFSLARIGWLVHDGSTLSSAKRDAVRDCFGLEWGADAYGNPCWRYEIQATPGPAAPQKLIMTLDQVAAAKREPNFFELLKAAILSGSLGRDPGIDTFSWGTSRVKGASGKDFDKIFSLTDPQIIQIGANIIDQYDADSYPTAIFLQGKNIDDTTVPSNGPMNVFYGIENLPYLNRMYVIGWNTGGPPAGFHGWVQPELWAPFQASTASTGRPTSFRLQAHGMIQMRLNSSSGNVLQSKLSALWNYNPGGNAENEAYIYFKDTLTAGASSFSNPRVILSTDDDNSVATTPAINIAPAAHTGASPYDASYSPTGLPAYNNFMGIHAGFTPYTVWSGATNPGAAYWATNAPNDTVMWERAGTFVDSAWTPTPILAYSLRYHDGTRFLPYTYMSRILHFTYGGTWSMSASNVGTTYSPVRGTSQPRITPHMHVDPLTDRMACNTLDGSHGGFDRQINRSYQFSTVPGSAGQYNAPWPANGVFFYNYNGMGGGPSNNGVPDLSAANGWSIQLYYGSWAQNIHTGSGSDAYYADPDGIVRPGNDCLFTTNDGVSQKQGGYSTATGVNAYTMGRRLLVLNRPFRSVGELGYAYRDLPFKSLDFFTAYSADSALLDVFSIVDQPAVIAGQINPNNASEAVLKAILSGGAKLESDAAYNMAAEITTASTSTNANMATAIADCLATVDASNNRSVVIANRADLVNQLGVSFLNGIVQTGATKSTLRKGYAFSTNKVGDQANKTYLEAPVRALSNVTDVRTWNLLIDVIAQSGRMSPNASTLADFMVDGERRYWLHIAIDRYTGKIVDQQLEPVYE